MGNIKNKMWNQLEDRRAAHDASCARDKLGGKGFKRPGSMKKKGKQRATTKP